MNLNLIEMPLKVQTPDLLYSLARVFACGIDGTR